MNVGIFKVRFFVAGALCCLVAALPACKQDNKTAPTAPTAAAKSAEPPPMPAMPVTVITVQPTSVPMSIEAVAQTEGASEVEIRPRVGGIILRKLFEEGAPVKTGQVLFIIDPVPFQIALTQAKAAAAGQGARITQTSREAKRLKELLETQSISQREYDNASSDASISQAGMQQAQANIKVAELNLSYTKVTAPVAGIAGRFLFSEGALVAPNTSLLTTITQVSPIWVRFSLSETDLKSLGGHVSSGNAREVSLVLPDGSEYAYKGKLNFAANQINPSLGTQELRATFQNTDKQLLPGQFVRARLTTGSREGVFLVPQIAVTSVEQGAFVFVVNEKNEAVRRPVVLGEWQGTDWIVLSGLNANDRVVVDNIIKLNMAPPGVPVAPNAMGEMPAKMPAAPATSKPITKSKT
jgi:membrane fusion protein, multidrug efflux system